MSINHGKIENLTLRILDGYNITEPVVDISKIVKDKGVEIKEVEMPPKYLDVAGFYDDKNKIIYVNINDKPVRKLFTIAHELGHIFLGHKNYSVLFRIPKVKEEEDYSEEEKEANSFAAHLLMPDFMLRDYLEKYNLSREDYKKMAEIFGVPVVSMKSQLEYLK
jgi:Zn-dependent peptidase ImmA (M78 family)